MRSIIIKRLSSQLIPDYLDFFDNRAFTDDNPNGPCYCTSPNQSEEEIRQMVSEFRISGVKETVRKYAVEMLDQNRIRGYLAYDGTEKKPTETVKDGETKLTKGTDYTVTYQDNTNAGTGKVIPVF